MTSNGNILDTPVPYIKGDLLKPTKYVKPKDKKTMINKIQEEVLNLFDKYRAKAKHSLTKSINWLNDLKNNVSDIFNKIQKKTEMNEPKFKLDKEALNVTKRYEMDLEKAGLSLYDPLSLLLKIKPLVVEKFKKYPSTKQQLSLVCLRKKTSCNWRRNYR